MASLQRIAAAVYIIEALNQEESERTANKRSIWMRDWLRKRPSDGAHQSLVQEFRAIENQKFLFENFLRMDGAIYDELLKLVSPRIRKIDTSMRVSISPSERLTITLRFLTTGDSYTSLAVLFRVAPSTISLIVPETCDNIYQVLKDNYLKVCSMCCAQSFKIVVSGETNQIVFNYTRRHQQQNNGKLSPISSKNCGTSPIVSGQWMESTSS